jgi:hypothetical protein
MPEITRAVGATRALVVPFGLGCPFGMPGDAEMQKGVLRALLALCGRKDVPVIDQLPIPNSQLPR